MSADAGPLSAARALGETAAATMAERHHSLEENHFGGLDPHHSFMTWNLLEGVFSGAARPFIIPVTGIVLGLLMMQSKQVSLVGKLVLYFGSQCFMNIYMGWVMRTHVTVPAGSPLPGSDQTLEVDLTGCPAGFALTAMQQAISFGIFLAFFSAAYFTPYRYTPKKLASLFDVVCVMIFGAVFALNIALNNFSLGYISIAVNLVIRSCMPLSTFVSQKVLAMVKLYSDTPCNPKELGLMVVGVVCAAVFTLARIAGAGAQSHEANNMVLGVAMCLASLLCGSLNMALAGVLGEQKLNVLDTVAYMAVPAALFLLPIAMLVPKPVPGEWPRVFGRDTMTDFEILQGVWQLNRGTMGWLALSGVFSFVYNIIQFKLVHDLSPATASFSGNFNKAAMIFLTLLLPFLRVHALPGHPYIDVIWGSVTLNIVAFSYYSYLQIQAKKRKAAAAEGEGESDQDSAALRAAKGGYPEDDEEQSNESWSDTSDGPEAPRTCCGLLA